MALTYTVNQNPTTGAVAVFNLKTLLKAAGWTITKSSDGTTFNNTGDQITTGASGSNGMDNSKAWFVAQQPVGGSAPFAGTRQFAFQRNSTTGANTSQAWKLKYSLSAGFTGGSPGVVQMPSATDEVVLLGGGTDAAPTFANLFGGADGAYRHQLIADNAAPFGWFSIGYPVGPSTSSSHGLYFDAMASSAFLPSDPDPYAIYVDGAAASASVWGMGNVNSETLGPFSWINKGLGSQAFVRTPGLSLNTASGVVAPLNTAQDAFVTKDVLVPLYYSRRAAQGSPVEWKGRSNYIMMNASASHSVGDTLTVSTSKDWFMTVSLALPWNGTTPTQ